MKKNGTRRLWRRRPSNQFRHGFFIDIDYVLGFHNY